VEFPQVFVEGLPLEKATWATPRDTERQAALCSMSAYLHRHLHFTSTFGERREWDT
jgi:hypothetical protein